jgi:hypothetical protein
VETVALELRLPPEWEVILAAWERCHAVLDQAGLSAPEQDALCMVARELLENAVKHGAYGPGDAVELSLRADAEDVTIEVRNPVDVPAEQLRRVREALRGLRDAGDPLAAYVDRLKALAREPTAPAGGLGLARIACEGRGQLDFHLVDGGSALAVSAVYLRGGRTT